MKEINIREKQVENCEKRIFDLLNEESTAKITPQENRAIGAISQILTPENIADEDASPFKKQDRIALLQENLLKNAVPKNATIHAPVLISLYLNALSTCETTEDNKVRESASLVCEMLNKVMGASQVESEKNEINEDRHWDLQTAFSNMSRSVAGIENLSISDATPSALGNKKMVLETYGELAREAVSANLLS